MPYLPDRVARASSLCRADHCYPIRLSRVPTYTPRRANAFYGIAADIPLVRRKFLFVAHNPVERLFLPKLPLPANRSINLTWR